jgi:hypothetical protein
MFQNNIRTPYALVIVAWSVILGVGGATVASGQSGVVAHWAFEGSAVDSGPNSLNGTLMGDAGFGGGKVGGALQLDGAGDYVDIHDPSGAFPAVLGGLSQGTISTWFKFDTFPTNGELHPIFYMGDATIGQGLQGPAKLSATLEVGHFFENDAKLYWTTYSDAHTPTMCFDTGFNLVEGQWYHFAVTVGPTGNTGYLNGQELVDRHYNFADASSPEFLEDVPAQEEVWIGRGFLASTPTIHYFPGTIDEVLVYDRPLTSTEVADYYAATVPEPATLGLLGLGALAILRPSFVRLVCGTLGGDARRDDGSEC